MTNLQRDRLLQLCAAEWWLYGPSFACAMLFEAINACE